MKGGSIPPTLSKSILIMTQDQYTIEQRANWIAFIQSVDSEQLTYLENILEREMYSDLEESDGFYDESEIERIEDTQSKYNKQFYKS
jgi:hypothetical protein